MYWFPDSFLPDFTVFMISCISVGVSSKMSIRSEVWLSNSSGAMDVIFELYSVDTVWMLSGTNGNMKFILSFRQYVLFVLHFIVQFG